MPEGLAALVYELGREAGRRAGYWAGYADAMQDANAADKAVEAQIRHACAEFAATHTVNASAETRHRVADLPGRTRPRTPSRRLCGGAA